jgi:hypothetical protein
MFVAWPVSFVPGLPDFAVETLRKLARLDYRAMWIMPNTERYYGAIIIAGELPEKFLVP